MRQHVQPVLRLAPSVAVTTVLSLSAAGLSKPASAQDAAGEQGETLPTISVTGEGPQSPLNRRPSMERLPDTIQDTPQSISVVPRELIEEKNITTLRDAVRNIPGIAINAGEGGAQGDTLTIRGFSARNDLFVDGLRDPGQYNRDSFNIEAIEALKGPSSLLFGRGSTGGAVNIVTKMPNLERSGQAIGSLGTGPFYRGTVDLNTPIGEHTAVRLNAMAQDSETVGRDVAEQSRWGFSPSIGFGLGTDTSLTLSWMHQEENNIPDYGLPFVFGKPAPVDTDSFYGLRDDFEDVQVDLLTAKLNHVATDWLMLSNVLRAGFYNRDATATAPRVTAAAGTPLEATTITRGRPSLDSQTTTVTNLTTATATFATGPVGHTVVGGVELGYEDIAIKRFSYPGTPAASLLRPDPDTGAGLARSLTSDANTEATTIAAFASDRIALTEQWSIVGGLRWDRFDADYSEDVAGTSFDRTDTMLSTRAALVFEPTDAQTYYFSYGTSFNPSAEYLALSTTTANLEPEKNRSFELGAKINLLDERLAVPGALFRTEKTNARTADPANATVTVLDGKQRVDGIELEVSGRILEGWNLIAGYTYLDGEIVEANDATKGKIPQNTPEHSGFVWTTYEPFKDVELGAGVYYVGDRWANNQNTNEVPNYWRFDTMVAYTIGDVRLALNGYNLADATIYEGVYAGHVIPGAGRTFIFSTAVSF
jgi:catecholate siderophore receptor